LDKLYGHFAVIICLLWSKGLTYDEIIGC